MTHDDQWALLLQRGDDGGGLIGGAVVDHDDLMRRSGLSPGAGNCLGQEATLLVTADDHAYPRRTRRVFELAHMRVASTGRAHERIFDLAGSYLRRAR
jgi:hypothetical protein